MVGSVTAGVKKGTFVWTDEEVELLLRATLDYKSRKAQDSVDWESCKSKYSDILMAFLEQYPVEAGNKDFPHDVSALTKAQIMTKIKNIRRNLGRVSGAVQHRRRDRELGPGKPPVERLIADQVGVSGFATALRRKSTCSGCDPTQKQPSGAAARPQKEHAEEKATMRLRGARRVKTEEEDVGADGGLGKTQRRHNPFNRHQYCQHK
ncbi:uncharacterized protein LOC105930431 isoform X2 [Fundulus heteroclitus]|uniref:uncharacterized protein LOC105930431 isoform X2 n=1 Tax=Fundulus heteroclitus TaxID=8078 RepID=UPI00165CD1F0|nr:uncharacterized protein LOC105930431 isoform X2 [Fundulus heteroclitus]